MTAFGPMLLFLVFCVFAGFLWRLHKIDESTRAEARRVEHLKRMAQQHIHEEEQTRQREEEARRRATEQRRIQEDRERQEKARRAYEEAERRARENEARQEKQGGSTRDKRPRIKTAREYGKILGLQGEVTKSDVKRRYRELADQYHPDKVNHLGPKLMEVAEAEMKAINEAYDYFKKVYDI